MSLVTPPLFISHRLKEEHFLNNVLVINCHDDNQTMMNTAVNNITKRKTEVEEILNNNSDNNNKHFKQDFEQQQQQQQPTPRQRAGRPVKNPIQIVDAKTNRTILTPEIDTEDISNLCAVGWLFSGQHLILQVVRHTWRVGIVFYDPDKKIGYVVDRINNSIHINVSKWYKSIVPEICSVEEIKGTNSNCHKTICKEVFITYLNVDMYELLKIYNSCKKRTKELGDAAFYSLDQLKTKFAEMDILCTSDFYNSTNIQIKELEAINTRLKRNIDSLRMAYLVALSSDAPRTIWERCIENRKNSIVSIDSVFEEIIQKTQQEFNENDFLPCL